MIKRSGSKKPKPPLTLDPLSPEEALADLLKVKPPPEKKKRGRRPKDGQSKRISK